MFLHQYYACLLVALQLLASEKQVGGVRPIVIGEVVYQLVTRTLVIQFKDTFAEHFCPRQFWLATSNEYEIVVHEVRAMLNLHP
jgi:hypothetical protein